MSYKTVEVELEGGRVWAREPESLPEKAHALLTILEPEAPAAPTSKALGSGLRRFLSTPDFSLTPEQFRASMEADFFDQ